MIITLNEIKALLDRQLFNILKAKVLSVSDNQVQLKINNRLFSFFLSLGENLDLKKGDILYLQFKSKKEEVIEFKVLYKEKINNKHLKVLKKNKLNSPVKHLPFKDLDEKFLDKILKNNIVLNEENINVIKRAYDILLKDLKIEEQSVLDSILKVFTLLDGKFKSYKVKHLVNFTKYYLKEDFTLEKVDIFIDKFFNLVDYKQDLDTNNYNYSVVKRIKDVNIKTILKVLNKELFTTLKVNNLKKTGKDYNIINYAISKINELKENKDNLVLGLKLLDKLIYNYFLFNILPVKLFLYKDNLVRFYIKKLYKKVKDKNLGILVRVDNLPDLSPLIFLLRYINDKKILHLWVSKRDYISMIEKDKYILENDFSIILSSVSLINEKIKKRFYE